MDLVNGRVTTFVLIFTTSAAFPFSNDLCSHRKKLVWTRFSLYSSIQIDAWHVCERKIKCTTQEFSSCHGTITSQGWKLILIHLPKKKSDQLRMDFHLKGGFFWSHRGDVVFSVMLKGVGLYYQDVYCSCGLATGGAGQGGGKFMGKLGQIWCDVIRGHPRRSRKSHVEAISVLFQGVTCWWNSMIGLSGWHFVPASQSSLNVDEITNKNSQSSITFTKMSPIFHPLFQPCKET